MVDFLVVVVVVVVDVYVKLIPGGPMNRDSEFNKMSDLQRELTQASKATVVVWFAPPTEALFWRCDIDPPALYETRFGCVCYAYAAYTDVAWC